MYILLAIYFILFTLLAWKNIKLGIYLILFTLPAYLIRFDIFNLPTTLLEGEILILFLIWVVKAFQPKADQLLVEKQELINKNFLLLYYFISLLLITSAISVFVSPNFNSALGVWKAYFIEPILFLIVFVSSLKKEDLKNVFYVFGAQILILSIFAIYQKFTGAFITNLFWQDEATRRVTSFFSYPNALALYLAPLVVLFLGVLFERYKIQDTRLPIGWSLKATGGQARYKKKLNFKFQILQVLYFISFVVGFVAIYLTKSKGALFAVLSGIIFYVLFYKGKRKIFAGILICIFMFLCFYVFMFGLPNLQGTSTVTGGDSVTTRVEMWSETWKMLKTKPILGAGLTGYQTAVAPFHEKEYIEIYLYPHNVFLNFWTEIGLLGLISFILIIIYFYLAGFSCHSELDSESSSFSIIIMATMTTLLAHGLVDVPYFKNDLSVLFWVIVGMMIINIKYKK